MKISVHYDQTSKALCNGGFGDVWKGEHRDQDVAVKVLKMYVNDDLQKTFGVGCRLCSLPHVDVLTISCLEVLQGGCDMEKPQAPKCASTDGGGGD